MIHSFKHKMLMLFKCLLLEKRILFFGQKVERLSCYQYGLVSLIPELLRNIEDVGSPFLDNFEVESIPLEIDLYNAEGIHKNQLHRMGLPLRVFGKGAFFQPYIPLQQIDILMHKETKSFLVGTTNSIFTHHKACAIDLLVNVNSILRQNCIHTTCIG